MSKRGRVDLERVERMRFIDIQVEEHEAIPDGCSMRFRAQDDGARIERIAWESEDGRAGTWRVVGRRSDGEDVAAIAYAVDDSSAGTSILVVGGDHGLRLTLEPVDPLERTPEAERERATVAEPYLLVSRAALSTA